MLISSLLNYYNVECITDMYLSVLCCYINCKTANIHVKLGSHFRTRDEKLLDKYLDSSEGKRMSGKQQALRRKMQKLFKADIIKMVE